MGKSTPKPTRPQLPRVSTLLYIHSLGLIQLEVRPTEKLLLVPARQAGSSGRILVESKLGALFGAMLAEQEGDPPKQSLAAQPDTLSPV